MKPALRTASVSKTPQSAQVSNTSRSELRVRIAEESPEASSPTSRGAKSPSQTSSPSPSSNSGRAVAAGESGYTYQPKYALKQSSPKNLSSAEQAIRKRKVSSTELEMIEEEEADSGMYLPEDTKLLQMRKQLAEASDHYERAKAEAVDREKIFFEKEQNLKRLEVDIQNQLAKFGRFLSENDAKRLRAERKAVEEAKFVIEKQKEIAQLVRDIAVVEQDRAARALELQNISCYSRFLHDVAEKCEGFNDINDVMDRFAMLSATEKNLMEQRESAQKRLTELQRDFNRYRTDRANEMARLSGNLASHQNDREVANIAAFDAEREADARIRRIASRKMESSEVTQAVENMYVRIIKISSERGVHRPAATNMVEKLDRIKEFMLDMKDLVESAKSGARDVPTSPGMSGASSTAANFKQKETANLSLSRSPQAEVSYVSD